MTLRFASHYGSPRFGSTHSLYDHHRTRRHNSRPDFPSHCSASQRTTTHSEYQHITARRHARQHNRYHDRRDTAQLIATLLVSSRLTPRQHIVTYDHHHTSHPVSLPHGTARNSTAYHRTRHCPTTHRSTTQHIVFTINTPLHYATRFDSTPDNSTHSFTINTALHSASQDRSMRLGSSRSGLRSTQRNPLLRSPSRRFSPPRGT
jgi:hypothetical protein